jgi:hypothetical protein
VEGPLRRLQNAAWGKIRLGSESLSSGLNPVQL